MLKYKGHDIYANSNGSLVFNQATGQATSYHWWNLVIKDKKGNYHLNEYPYSRTTKKQVTYLKTFLANMGITPVIHNSKDNLSVS